MNKPIILTLVGMPGSGKGTCIERVLETYPNTPPKLYFGGITVDEVRRRGQEVNETNERIVREELRAKEGKESYAIRISKKIDELIAQGHNRIVVDGLYSWSEYKVFKEKYGDDAVILAVAAARKVRHERLAHRPIRPLTDAEVTRRDYAEIENLEKGGPIANADYTILNDGTTEQLFRKLDALLKKINF